jgi:hypothetical protein
MKRHGLMLIAVWVGLTATCWGAKEPLNVVVLDYVGLKTEDVAQAVELGRQFFGMVGVKTIWALCREREHCSLPSSGGFVQVSIVSWANGMVLGFNNVEASAAGKPDVYVFHTRINGLARKTQSPLSLVLACVMVHEILHSLGLEHAPIGIMRPTIGREELTSFQRSPSLAPTQTRQINSAMAQLLGAAGAAVK